MLRIRGLRMHFGGVRALDGVDLDIAAGEIVGLIGPNGSGKSTLINCISGVIAPTEGTVELDGTNITRMRRAKRARLGLVRTYQNLRLFSDMTVAENVEVAARSVGHGRQSRQLTSMYIRNEDLTHVSRQPVSELSYGMQRKTEITRALIAGPRLLALDEPAAGLGETDTQRLIVSIRQFNEGTGGTVLLVDHDMNLVSSLSDRIVVLHEGQVLTQGIPHDVLSDPRVADVYLGSGGHS